MLSAWRNSVKSHPENSSCAGAQIIMPSCRWPCSRAGITIMISGSTRRTSCRRVGFSREITTLNCTNVYGKIILACDRARPLGRQVPADMLEPDRGCPGSSRPRTQNPRQARLWIYFGLLSPMATSMQSSSDKSLPLIRFVMAPTSGGCCWTALTTAEPLTRYAAPFSTNLCCERISLPGCDRLAVHGVLVSPYWSGCTDLRSLSCQLRGRLD